MMQIDIYQSIAILLICFVLAVHFWLDDRRKRK